MKNNYVLKRIFIGVAIGTILMFVRRCDVNAQQINVNGAISQCRGLYLNNGNNAYFNGSVSYESSNYGPPVFRCDYTNYVYNDYYTQYFALNRNALGSNAPTIDINKKYKFTFYVHTKRQVPMTTPNSLITFKISQSGVNGNVYQSFDNGSRCTVTFESQSVTSQNIVAQNNYKVVCEDFKFTSTTWTNLYIYASADNSGAPSTDNVPWIYLIYIDQLIDLEEYTTLADVQNELTDFDMSGAGHSFDAIGFEPPQYNGVIGNLFTLPLEVYTILNNRLIDNCSDLVIPSTSLPFYNWGIWDNSVGNDNLRIKCLRYYIEDSTQLNFGYYETIGTIVGVFLIGKVLLKKGRSLVKMGELTQTNEDMWGGLE